MSNTCNNANEHKHEGKFRRDLTNETIKTNIKYPLNAKGMEKNRSELVPHAR